MATYIPRVLICGNVEEFKKKIGNKPVEIVGQIIFDKTGDDVKLFFGEKVLTSENINQMLDGVAEYLIFIDALEFYYYLEKFPPNAQIMTVDVFVKKIHDGFFSYNMIKTFGRLLSREKFLRCMLDFDSLFAKSDFHTCSKLEFEINCLAENIYPIMENFYNKIYRSFDECKFHHFDAIILSKERSPEEFIDVLIETDSLTEKIFAFVRKNSALERWIAANQNIFAQVEYFRTSNGAWCLLKKIISPADVGVYVVTHKDAQLDTLPEGYKFIHAGHALAKKDFGYAGDDTGENISRLNPFLDEVTALYWIWKNTSHTHTGFCHYRRFLTCDNQENFDVTKILSVEEILSILKDNDIIVANECMTFRSQRDIVILSTGQPDLVRIAEKIIRKHLLEKQPDYLNSYDDVMNGFMIFPGSIHITRRNIFNAYCKWLFSFVLDAVEEMRYKIKIGNKNLEEMGHDYSRVAGYFAERMLTIWLMKNHLRIKTLPMMYRENV